MNPILIAVLATAAFFVLLDVCKHCWERRTNRGAHARYDKAHSPAGVISNLRRPLRTEQSRYQAFQAAVLADHDAHQGRHRVAEPVTDIAAHSYQRERQAA